jgi:hypothetical protein
MGSKDYIFKSCGEAGGDLLAGVHWASNPAEPEAGKKPIGKSKNPNCLYLASNLLSL